MKAVMYGGGNIGRGFVGMLFSQSGYEVSFIDVVQNVVDELNKKKSYPVRVVHTSGHTDFMVGPVNAVNGNDKEKAAQAISEADIMATAVGVRALRHIIPNIALGIHKRRKQNGSDLNIIICENLMDADKIIDKLLREAMDADDISWYEEHVGLVEASIGRMVPVQTEDMKDGEPLRVCVERYGFLPVNRSAFKGTIPKIKNLVPYEPFSYYIERKLYVHNMGHSVCAYLGNFLGKEFIYEAIDESNIRCITEGAMLESIRSLALKYKAELEPLILHVQDLLERFTNKALRDTCARVGADPQRKLSPGDRLIGSASLCLEQGVYSSFIMAGCAAAVYHFLQEKNVDQSVMAAREILREVSGLKEDSELAAGILDLYEMLLTNTSVKQIADKARAMKNERLGEIV